MTLTISTLARPPGYRKLVSMRRLAWLFACVGGMACGDDGAASSGAGTTESSDAGGDSTTGATDSSSTGVPSTSGTPTSTTGTASATAGSSSAGTTDITTGDPPAMGCVDSPAPAGMACIAGGMFENGQPPFAQRNVATYWIDLTEVTVAAYDECVNAGVCTPPAVDPTDPNPQWCNWQVAGREDHPVNCVDWSQADAYCAWAGKRLPDEWEWEWAARGRDAARPYPWGDEFPSCMRAWMIDDAAGGPGRGTLSTASVGSKPSGASRDGVLDLGGSVWEWTASVAESDAASRMQRGASFDNRGTVVFLAYHRVAVPATAGWSSDGFRCAQTP